MCELHGRVSDELALYSVDKVFGSGNDDISALMYNGVLTWGDPVSRVIEDGELLLSQARNSDKTPLVSVLIEGRLYYMTIM